MSKIVINGVDGNFGSLVAKYALELMNKEDLVFTCLLYTSPSPRDFL